LYESGLDELCDCIVAVVADEETRLRRALARDYRDKEQANIDKVRARIRAQMSDDELRSRADYILENPEGAKPEQLAELLIRHLKDNYS
jgi:dephospho-CoA kinase